LKTEIDDGVGSERGPWCFVCGEWLPWWESEEGCYTKEVDFADYFAFEEKEHPAVRRTMRKHILQMYGRKCFACGKTLSDDEITIDHIVARSRGGTGDQANLQVLCGECNRTKGDTMVEESEAVLHFPMRPVPSDAYEGVTW
jgi:5-methylcytosine-specific restriction endonuclease McrA